FFEFFLSARFRGWESLRQSLDVLDRGAGGIRFHFMAYLLQDFDYLLLVISQDIGRVSLVRFLNAAGKLVVGLVFGEIRLLFSKFILKVHSRGINSSDERYQQAHYHHRPGQRKA